RNVTGVQTCALPILSVGISEPEPAELEVSRMRRRHLKAVMAIERQVYPRPWSPSLFLSEMSETGNRAYLVAKLGRDVVAYGGVRSEERRGGGSGGAR